MPRRFRRTGRSSTRKKAVYWDAVNLAKANLPTALLDETGAIDGGFSGFRRFQNVTDRTVRRSIYSFRGSVDLLDFQVDGDAMLEVCVGIGIFDSNQDTDGQAVNTQFASSTGPLSDASNSRWMVRCCIQIPIGRASLWGSTENIGQVTDANGGWWLYSGGTAATGVWLFGCDIDTKVMRKLHGTETQWMNVCMEAAVDPLPVAGDDVSVFMDAFSGRILLQNAA